MQAACLRARMGKALVLCMAQGGSVSRGTFALDEPEFDWGAAYGRPATLALKPYTLNLCGARRRGAACSAAHSRWTSLSLTGAPLTAGQPP